MKAPAAIAYLRAIWHLDVTGKTSTRTCRVCAKLISPQTRCYKTTTTGVLKGIGPRDVICVECGVGKVDDIAFIEGVDMVDV